MMKICTLSDLHREFGKFRFARPVCDVVLLAGDIDIGLAGITWAGEIEGPTIYVPGNHEFYGKNRDSMALHMDRMAKKAASLGVTYLLNSVAVIKGVRFVGTTLWTDFNLFGNFPLGQVNALVLEDYKNIYTGINRLVTPEEILNQHIIAFTFLQNTLAEEFDGPTVVVTHHAPSEVSCGPNFKNDILNVAYASNLTRFVEAMGPVLWIHGHIHTSNDYMIGNTRVVSNPRGYVGHKLNANFDPAFIVEI